MKKIGLITSYHGNYGSVLQCYATKKTIEKKGYVCDVIYEKYAGFEKIRHIIYRLFLIIVYSLFVPGFCFRYFRARKAAKMHRGAMEKDSFKMVDFFVNTSLKPKGYSYSCLKKLADKNAFDFFICGSDQIWNCNNGQVSPFAFLQFSNADKNIALSPSFGSSSIPYYCRKTIRKYLSKFQKNKITVREESGRDIIEHLSKFVPQVMPDPVNLLSRDEWSDFANNSSFLYKDYALLHFLNKPSFDALKLIEEYSKEGKRFIAIGYNRSSFLNFDGVIFINGAPFDYLWLIKNADYILTDSFHTTQFSILFSKPFLTFDRKYDSGVKSQSTRIENILSIYSLEDRFIRGGFVDYTMLDYIKIDENIIEAQKKRIENYLEESISFQKELGASIKKEDCTLCGACLESCNFDALQVEDSGAFSNHPIKNSLCVGCGKCNTVCNRIISNSYSFKKKAYVGYCTNLELKEKSASGGIFASIASVFLSNKGVVAGAILDFSGIEPKVYHKCIYSLEELPLLLGSKYVQSTSYVCYSEIKDNLQKGKNVLFCGTSCQVEGLKKYLQNDYENLFTMDLICHGVIKQSLFQEHIKVLERKYKGKIVDFSFRKKDCGKIQYVEKLSVERNNGTISKVEVRRPKYIKMFMSGEFYRDSCYNCQYSSINKVSDITVGDYFEYDKDLDHYDDLLLDSYISSIIIHNSRGEELIERFGSELRLYTTDIFRMQLFHPQLCFPATYSMKRIRAEHKYKRRGIKGIYGFSFWDDTLLNAMKKPIRLLKRVLKK